MAPKRSKKLRRAIRKMLKQHGSNIVVGLATGLITKWITEKSEAKKKPDERAGSVSPVELVHTPVRAE